MVESRGSFLKRPENSSTPKTYPKSSRKLFSAFLKAPGKFGPVEMRVIIYPETVTGARVLPKTFSGNMLAIKWHLSSTIHLF